MTELYYLLIHVHNFLYLKVFSKCQKETNGKTCFSNFTSIFKHVKLEKFKRGRSPSLHLGKEGDVARNSSAAFILSRNIKKKR